MFVILICLNAIGSNMPHTLTNLMQTTALMPENLLPVASKLESDENSCEVNGVILTFICCHGKSEICKLTWKKCTTFIRTQLDNCKCIQILVKYTDG